MTVNLSLIAEDSMDKDIFVDNNVTKNFCNPVDPEYKKFIQWLFSEGILVVSNKLLSEYHSSISHSPSESSIGVIINKLLSEGRLKKISNKQLKNFIIKKHILNKLRSNKKDHEYIIIVLLSDRKYAITIDQNLKYDINHYPGYHAIAVSRPEKIDYSS